MSTIALDKRQRKLALDLHERLSERQINSPQQILDTWHTPAQESHISDTEGSLPSGKAFVSPEQIKGPASEYGLNRLEPAKLMHKLKLLVEGEFDEKRMYPPYMRKRGNEYYVAGDGHHRCLAAKALGLERLYVEYEEVPSEYLE